MLLIQTFSFSQGRESEDINSLIEKKRSFYEGDKKNSAFIIQLYNGSEQEAYSIEKKFKSLFRIYDTRIIYKLPEWKMQVVYFYTRLEADFALKKIKPEFENAIVLEEKI